MIVCRNKIFVFFSVVKLLLFLSVNSINCSNEILLEKEISTTTEVYLPNIQPTLAAYASDKTNYWHPTDDFVQATFTSFSVTVLSELGDKTFFLAAILAMKQSRWQVFVGTMSALAPMTVFAVIFGVAASFIPKIVLRIASSALLSLFGFNMLREGISMSEDVSLNELKKCEKDLEVNNNKSSIITKAFTLTLLGEIGDRSQLATILLATTEDIHGVAFGGVLGHAVCTGAAVLGGRFLAQNIPVKTMTTTGGMVFLIFSVTNWISF